MARIEKLAEGKTKIIWKIDGINTDKEVEIQSKDDFEGKGVISNRTTCNIFEFLADCGIVNHYIEKVDSDAFKAIKCKMIPLEVVARRRADGSYLERHPDVRKETIFPRLVVEFFLKSDEFHDPMIKIQTEKNGASKYYWKLYDAHRIYPNYMQNLDKIYSNAKKTVEPLVPIEDVQEMENQTRFIFLLLERAWKNLGVDLWDLKLEFGYNMINNNELLLADVIDNDSWRITKDGVQLDKQTFRDGNVPMEEITRRYELVKNLTPHFKEMVNYGNNIYHPQIVILHGSEKDIDCVNKIAETLGRINKEYFFRHSISIQASAHRETLKLLKIISEESHKNNSVIFICVAGMQNELAPVVAAHTAAPVISCSPSVKDFPNDIWSNVRLPSGVATGFVWYPEQAALQALKIIAQVNPLVYAKLQSEVEDRFDVEKE